MNVKEIRSCVISETRVSAGPVGTITVMTINRGKFITEIHGETVMIPGREILSGSVRVSQDEQSARAFHQRVVDEVSKFCERMEQLFEKGE